MDMEGLQDKEKKDMSKYVVVDLEMCRVLRGMRCKEYPFSSETIQIGAALLDENYKVIDTFSTYVRPEYGWISSDIERLTGISADELINAPYFEEALKLFANWIPEEDAAMVEWSNADEIQLRKEMEAKNIENHKIAELIEDCIDCQELFSLKLNEEKRYNLTQALISADIIPEGREHDGMCDAYNTALLFAKLRTSEHLILNPLIERAKNETVEHLQVSIGSLFAGLNLAVLPA